MYTILYLPTSYILIFHFIFHCKMHFSLLFLLQYIFPNRSGFPALVSLYAHSCTFFFVWNCIKKVVGIFLVLLLTHCIIFFARDIILIMNLFVGLKFLAAILIFEILNVVDFEPPRISWRKQTETCFITVSCSGSFFPTVSVGDGELRSFVCCAMTSPTM